MIEGKFFIDLIEDFSGASLLSFGLVDASNLDNETTELLEKLINTDFQKNTFYFTSLVDRLGFLNDEIIKRLRNVVNTKVETRIKIINLSA